MRKKEERKIKRSEKGSAVKATCFPEFNSQN